MIVFRLYDPLSENNNIYILPQKLTSPLKKWWLLKWSLFKWHVSRACQRPWISQGRLTHLRVLLPRTQKNDHPSSYHMRGVYGVAFSQISTGNFQGYPAQSTFARSMRCRSWALPPAPGAIPWSTEIGRLGLCREAYNMYNICIFSTVWLRLSFYEYCRLIIFHMQ